MMMGTDQRFTAEGARNRVRFGYLRICRSQAHHLHECFPKVSSGLREDSGKGGAGLGRDPGPAALGRCRFHNCTHIHEPGCGVREAEERGAISASRRRIYEELFEELSIKRW